MCLKVSVSSKWPSGLLLSIKRAAPSMQLKLGAGDEGAKFWEAQVAAFCVTLEFVKEAMKRTGIYKLPLKA